MPSSRPRSIEGVGGHELSPSERVTSERASEATSISHPRNRTPILSVQTQLHPRCRGLDKLVRGRSSSKTSPPVPLAGSREDGGAKTGSLSVSSNVTAGFALSQRSLRWSQRLD